MSKLGELLKQTRMEKGITCDYVTKETRLSEDIIHQMEDGGFNDLPSYNHAKNFVKMYAEILGLDWEQVRPLLEEECNKTGFISEPTVVIPMDELHADKKDSKDVGVFIKYIVPAVIIIAIIFAGVRLAASIKHERAQKIAQEQVQQQQQQQNDTQGDDDTEFNTVDQKTVQDTINAVNSQEQSDQQTTDQTAAAAKNGVQAGTPLPGVEPGAKPADQKIAPDAKTAQTTDQNAVDPSLKKATLNFADVCWVHAKSDTGEEMDFIGDKKTHKEISFKNYFILDVGNAAVATVTYNGSTSGGLGGYKAAAKNVKFQIDPASGALKIVR